MTTSVCPLKKILLVVDPLSFELTMYTLADKSEWVVPPEGLEAPVESWWARVADVTQIRKSASVSIHAINAIRAQRRSSPMKWIPSVHPFFRLAGEDRDYASNLPRLLDKAVEHFVAGPNGDNHEIRAQITGELFEFVKEIEFAKIPWPQIVLDTEDDTDTMVEARAAFARSSMRPTEDPVLTFRIEKARAKLAEAEEALRALELAAARQAAGGGGAGGGAGGDHKRRRKRERV